MGIHRSQFSGGQIDFWPLKRQSGCQDKPGDSAIYRECLWIIFKHVDLSHKSSVFLSADPTQLGGKLWLRLGNPAGKEIASILVDQERNPDKPGSSLEHYWKVTKCRSTPVYGVHDLYIVYSDPSNTKSSIWTTLFLDWIEFRKD